MAGFNKNGMLLRSKDVVIDPPIGVPGTGIDPVTPPGVMMQFFID